MTKDKNRDRLREYCNILLKYNKKTNIISRKISEEQLQDLIRDSCNLGEYINCDRVIDMGSGNGILGITLAIVYPEKHFTLVDSVKKKIKFLEHVKKVMQLNNVEVIHSDVLSMVKNKTNRYVTLISRGYTGRPVIRQLMKNKFVREILLITSTKKMENLEKDLDNYRKTVYNMNSRDILKIISLENVSRETKM
jgi:16S rRNA (guanine(527)-N(7))-methyltransferase RsmG